MASSIRPRGKDLSPSRPMGWGKGSPLCNSPSISPARKRERILQWAGWHWHTLPSSQFRRVDQPTPKPSPNRRRLNPKASLRRLRSF